MTKVAKKTGVSKWAKKAMTATGDFASDVADTMAKQVQEIKILKTLQIKSLISLERMDATFLRAI